MAVTEQIPTGGAIANGVSTVFPFGYYVIQADDLVVMVDGIAKTLNVDYTLSGVGVPSGGQITFSAAPAAGAAISHFRDTSLTRSIDYQTTGDLYANTIDFDIDRVWMALQEIFSGGKSSPNSLRVPAGEVINSFPKASQRVNKVPYFDGIGQAALADLSGLSVVIGDMGSVVVKGNGVTPNAGVVASANLLATATGKSLRFEGVSVVESPVTITARIDNGYQQIFSSNSQVTIATGQDTLIDWFGPAGGTRGELRRAINALPVIGGRVRGHPSGDYLTGFDGLTAAKVANGSGVAGVDYLAKNNVTVLGGKSPLPKVDGGNNLVGLESGTGTRFLGTLYYHASGLRFRHLGVDSGLEVCTALYGGVAQEGLAGVQVNKASPVFYRDCVLEDVRAICKGPSEQVHAILMEACIGLTANNLIGYYAFHGLVCKSRNARISNSAGIETGGESCITKSDSYAPAEDVKWSNCEATSYDGTLDAGFGILTEAVTAPLSNVSYVNCTVRNKANAFCARSNGAALADVKYTNLNIEACPIGVLLSGDVRRTTGQGVVNNNSTYAVQVDDTVTDVSNSIVGLKITNATDGIRAGGKIVVDDVHFDGISGLCLNHTSAAARIKIDNYTTGSSITGSFWSLQPGALANGWVNEGSAGAPVFRVLPDGGRIRLSGRIKSGSAAQVLAALSVQIRPTEDVSVKVSGLNGVTQTTATLQVVASTGQIVIPDYAGSPTWVQLEASWPIPA